MASAEEPTYHVLRLTDEQLLRIEELERLGLEARARGEDARRRSQIIRARRRAIRAEIAQKFGY